MKYYRDKGIKPVFKVKNALAVTPKQMDILRKQNLPISSYILSSDFFNDGDESIRFDDLPLGEQRGIDVNHIWDAGENSKRKIAEFKRNQAAQKSEGGV